jgi:hypothetical protein
LRVLSNHKTKPSFATIDKCVYLVFSLITSPTPRPLIPQINRVPHSQNTNIRKKYTDNPGHSHVQDSKIRIKIVARNINANIAQREIGHPQESKQANRKEEYYRKLPQCVTYREDSYHFIFNPYLF